MNDFERSDANRSVNQIPPSELDANHLEQALGVVRRMIPRNLTVELKGKSISISGSREGLDRIDVLGINSSLRAEGLENVGISLTTI